MDNVLRSYLISLGFGVDQPELEKFEKALGGIDDVVGDAAESMGLNFAKFAIGANAAVASVAVSLVALVDHVAMADQSFRFFGIHSYLNVDAARSFKIALDSLGVSLSDVYRDPESYARFTQLLEDQAALAKGLPSDFEDVMKDARSLRFEFSRLRIESEYGLMALSETIFKGFGGENFLSQFRSFNDWLIRNLPAVVNELSADLNPLLRDTRDIGKEVLTIFGDLSSVFLKFSGEVMGDEALKTGVVSFHNLAVATERWSDALLYVVKLMDDTFDAAINLFSLDPKKIAGSFQKLWSDALLKDRVSDAWGEAHQSEQEADRLQKQRLNMFSGDNLQKQAQAILGGLNAPTEQKVIQAAKEAGVPASIALSVAYQESRFNQGARSPAGAVGVMQLMPGTAKDLGVNASDEDQNITGGLRYLRQLYDKFGDWAEAVQAYNSGPGNVLKGILPAETAAYVPQVMGRAADLSDAWRRYDAGSRAAVQPMAYHVTEGDHNVSVGDVHVHVTQPHATAEEIAHTVKETLRQETGKETAKNLFELGGVFA